jgi:hypothetical protein
MRSRLQSAAVRHAAALMSAGKLSWCHTQPSDSHAAATKMFLMVQAPAGQPPRTGFLPRRGFGINMRKGCLVSRLGWPALAGCGGSELLVFGVCLAQVAYLRPVSQSNATPHHPRSTSTRSWSPDWPAGRRPTHTRTWAAARTCTPTSSSSSTTTSRTGPSRR